MTAKVHKRARPRTRPSWYGTIVEDRQYRLPAGLVDELCDIAELQRFSRKAHRMIRDVTEELAMFRSAQAALDKSPRPAHKRQLLESVLKQATGAEWIEAAEALTYWDGPLAWEFRCAGFPPDADQDFFKREWPRMAEAVLAKLSEQDSRHGRTQKAKHRLISNVAFIFDKYADPEHEPGWQMLKADFVDTALTAVGFNKATKRSKATSRFLRELPERFTPGMMQRQRDLYRKIVQEAEGNGQTVERFLIANPNFYAAYRDAARPKVARRKPVG